MNNTRDKFIETTSRLLESQGYHATSLNQIVQESGAPKGSLYYHFPGGKEELAAEAVQRSGDRFAYLIREHLAEDIPIHEALRDYIYQIAREVEDSNFSAGGPLTAIAMETATTNEHLNQACQAAFAQIQAAFTAKLETAGFPAEQAAYQAIFITSAIEGGIILSRTHHSGDPLEQVAEELHKFLEVQNLLPATMGGLDQESQRR